MTPTAADLERAMRVVVASSGAIDASTIVNGIAQALADERERCAKVADSMKDGSGTATKIAAAIRAGKEG